MGRVIEVVSGQPFDRFLQERFFDPIGMPDTGFQVPKDKVGRLTTSYLHADGNLIPIDPGSSSIYLDKPPFPFGGSGLASTPRDYDRFLEMLVGYGEIGGKRVMSEAAVRMGTSNLLPDTLAPDGGYQRNGKAEGFGAAGSVGSGLTAGTYGWAGAAGTIGFVDMRTGLRAGLFTQYTPNFDYPLLDEFPAAIVKDVLARRAG
jgi:CubicO group peptidase (beta-lactamase class C family)